MELNELIEVMKKAMDRYDLSDEYLKENGHETRECYVCEENHYGITTVPCSVVYPYLIELEKMKKENNEPVKHGKWMSYYDDDEHELIYYCSECGHRPVVIGDLNEEDTYCSVCGARMDGE